VPSALGLRRRVAPFAALLLSTPAAGQVAERCAPCHGRDGISTAPGVPSIAAQPKVFLENLLVLVREGLRGGEAMQKVMKGSSDREISALAEHYAKLAAPAPSAGGDPELLARGRELAGRHRCGTCHLPDYRGREQIPRLAAQREEVLVESMRLFRDAPPPGGDTLMSAALYGVSDTDIRAMAHFLARAR
jgi:cytochrome c553